MLDRSSTTIKVTVGCKELSPESHEASFEPLPDPTSIVRMWGGMEGDIWIVHSAWDKDTVYKKVIKDLPDRRRVKTKDIHDIVNSVTMYGRHLVEGDVWAERHIQSVLRYLYRPSRIREINAWELGEDKHAVANNPDFAEMRSQNVILIGGPIGNPATSLFLESLGLKWFFSNSGMMYHGICRCPDDDSPLGPVWGRQGELEADYGLFFRAANRFGPGKRVYAVMGAYAWGTQAAAAAACASHSASEILSTRSWTQLHAAPAEYCGWVKIWRNDKEGKRFLNTFSDDRESCYRIEWPKSPSGREWHTHGNPASIDRTLDLLLKLTQTFVIPARTGDILGLAASVAMLTAGSLAWVWGHLGPSIGLPSVVLSVLGVASFGLRVWPVTTPPIIHPPEE